VLTNTVWERIQNSYFETASTPFKAEREKGVGTPFPRVSVPLHPWVQVS